MSRSSIACLAFFFSLTMLPMLLADKTLLMYSPMRSTISRDISRSARSSARVAVER